MSLLFFVNVKCCQLSLKSDNLKIKFSEYLWNIETVNFYKLPATGSNRTQARPVDGWLAVTLFNKQSGVKQIATVCGHGKRFSPKSSDLFCHHLGYSYGDWRVYLESSQYNSRSVSVFFIVLSWSAGARRNYKSYHLSINLSYIS